MANINYHEPIAQYYICVLLFYHGSTAWVRPSQVEQKPTIAIYNY